MKAAAFALVAWLPMIAGTTPASAAVTTANDGARFITIGLCEGGTIRLNLGGDADGKGNGDTPAPCHPFACHAAPCRKQAGAKKFDPAQGLGA